MRDTERVCVFEWSYESERESFVIKTISLESISVILSYWIPIFFLFPIPSIEEHKKFAII